MSAILRVRLLSSPQQKQAASTASAGQGLPSSAPSGTLISTAPAMMAIIPSATRRSTFSRKTNHASSAVKTPSAFSRREAPDAGMFESPNISSTGAAIPPVRMAPARGSASLRRSRTRGARRATRRMPRPMPDPQ